MANKTIADELNRILPASNRIKTKAESLQLTKSNGNTLVRSTDRIQDYADAIENIEGKSSDVITPGLQDQTISKGKYLMGDQTIKGVSLSGTANNILKGESVSIKSGDETITTVEGTLEVNHYYTGSALPETSFGKDGDFYLVIS